MLRYVLVGLAFGIPDSVLALDRDFYTYNSIVETEDAFRRIALVFNDGKYAGLFAVVAIFGVLVGTYSSLFIATPVMILVQTRRAEKEGVGAGQKKTASNTA